MRKTFARFSISFHFSRLFRTCVTVREYSHTIFYAMFFNNNKYYKHTKLNMKNVVTNFDPHKFSMNELFANNNGKTSSTKVVGFITSMVCLLLFLMLVIYFFINPAAAAPILEFIDRTVTYFSVSAGLMGVKSITSAFGRHKIAISSVDKKPKQKDSMKPYENEGEDVEVVDDEDEETEEEDTTLAAENE